MSRYENSGGSNAGDIAKRRFPGRLCRGHGIPGRKYGVIYRSVLMENLQYVANMALGFFGYFVFIYIFIKLWEYMYRTPEELIAGYSKEQMIWYVMMTEMMRVRWAGR